MIEVKQLQNYTGSLHDLDKIIGELIKLHGGQTQVKIMGGPMGETSVCLKEDDDE